jgi:hypothetical protein
MWETLHLFSRYNKINSVQATSSDELNVSAYATANNANDSVTVALVNRSQSQQTVVLNFPNYFLTNQAVTTLSLANLQAGTETFVSHSNNALHSASISPPSNNTLQVTLAPLSVTSLLITGSLTALPLTLLSFTATKGDDEVILHFKTADELNFASFDVERSPDGVSFTKIGSVPAGGPQGAATGRDYTFTDVQPLPSLSYYRLKLVDLDGSSTYSKVVAIRWDKNSFITLFPNPAKDVVNVQLGMPAGTVSLQIVDALGRTVRNMRLTSSGSTLSVAIDVSGFARGSYYIHAGGETLRFIKQ